MNKAVELAKATLLDPAALELQHIHRLFGQLMSHKIDYADIYFQRSRSESWSLEDGAVKSGSRNIDQGVGIRAVSGEKTLHEKGAWSTGTREENKQPSGRTWLQAGAFRGSPGTT